ncbi:MAG TPA: hypothetical protein VFW27_36045, partial [Actinoplanes sp.]|nr:hypothetical protein [Actinoplanes sp.]
GHTGMAASFAASSPSCCSSVITGPIIEHLYDTSPPRRVAEEIHIHHLKAAKGECRGEAVDR